VKSLQFGYEQATKVHRGIRFKEFGLSQLSFIWP
jgi:hypothetical protein